MKHILLAGATGYLGGYIARELKARGFHLTLIVRSARKLENSGLSADRVIEGDLRDEATYLDAFDQIDAVISTVGITRQRDGLSYMDVDYGINRMILQNAERHAVKKFIYVSVLHGEALRHLAICDAKERFVDLLRQSPVESTVIRPSGFFSDMGEFFDMAKRGRVYLFGDGSVRANPIHGADLAKLCVDALQLHEQTLEAGGPEVLSHNTIAELAFSAAGEPVRITHIPDWVRRALLNVLPLVMTKARFGPIAFFLNVMAMQMRAPCYGHRSLEEHFKKMALEQHGSDAS
jgi:uncharacterized protein YbjT (DUF2867 family)